MNNNLTTNASNEAESPAFLVGAVMCCAFLDWVNLHTHFWKSVHSEYWYDKSEYYGKKGFTTMEVYELFVAQHSTNTVLGAVDVKYLGIPNICFSLTDKDDKREIHFIKQRIERGFDDSETWSLRDSMALFILPRLKRYQEIANDFLKRDDELVKDIDCFIKAMELVSRDNGSCIHTSEEEKQMFEGLEKFHKIFMSLWW